MRRSPHSRINDLVERVDWLESLARNRSIIGQSSIASNRMSYRKFKRYEARTDKQLGELQRSYVQLADRFDRYNAEHTKTEL